MTRSRSLQVGLGILALAFLTGASGAGRPARAPGVDTPAQPVVSNRATESPTEAPAVSPRITTADLPSGSAAVTPVYSIDWLSVNGGGATEIAGTAYEMGVSVGQPVAGSVSGTAYELGIGFWYGVGPAACPIAQTGDVNLAGGILTSDIIYLVNYVLKAGPDPLPCAAAGDVNCDGSVITSDIIYLVNYVLKAGPAPCDVCTLIPGTWSCP